MTTEKDSTDITDLPSLVGWHARGQEINATHLIVATDEGDPFAPFYAMPDEDYRDVVGRLEGGGHIFETYDLSKPLTQADLDLFYRWAL